MVQATPPEATLTGRSTPPTKRLPGATVVSFILLFILDHYGSIIHIRLEAARNAPQRASVEVGCALREYPPTLRMCSCCNTAAFSTIFTSDVIYHHYIIIHVDTSRYRRNIVIRTLIEDLGLEGVRARRPANGLCLFRPYPSEGDLPRYGGVNLFIPVTNHRQ